MEDFGALLDSHDCTGGQCSRRWSHTQAVRVSPEDVASAADEIRMLNGVRDQLTERGFQMLEGEPTPRFDDPGDGEPKPWSVKYAASLPSAGRPATGARPAPRFALLRRLWG